MRCLEVLKDFYKEPVAAQPICDKEQIDKTYAEWRMRIFLSMFVGYVIFYMCRKNISVALPAMQADLGFTMTELGLLGSSLYFTYAIGKFVNGLIADNTNVKRILPTALLISAVTNLLFVLCAYILPTEPIRIFGLPPFTILLWTLAFFWGINGWFQSMGFPPIAKNLSYWFSNKERGLKWSLWSSSHEVGTYLSVILSGFLVVRFGWQSAFYVPAIIAVIFCFFFYKNLQDKPTSIGLPDIEKYKDPDYVEPTEEESKEETLPYKEIFIKYILKNPTVWLLALAYVFVYVVRYGTIDWIVIYLHEEKKYSIETAAACLSFLPLVGVLGTIGAGFVSDKFFKGKRAPVNIICLSLLALCLYGFMINNIVAINYLLVSLIGVFTCGPQVLIGGLSAVESSSKQVASAVTGFCGMFGYVGAILSGVGTGLIVDKFSWDGAIIFWIVSALISLSVCTLLLKKELKK
ncbi:MAG: MFS transporter [Cyanobacteria bacterium SIG28]|nr:MFS transporter [Cyanobacteria bacterium SIG28]